ncbi:MAG: glycosyltransferase [Methylacidiphilales bacterium]|nr:glycosyltransferase [Candidatus Methylacidiphilales bacterium]MDW8349543.1 glycosyltransferase [Verrucomicrobiae bacterium]
MTDQSLSIAILSQTDTGGGATLVPARLHRALRSQGIDSHLIVSQRSPTSDPFTHTIPTPYIPARIAEKLFNRALLTLGLRNIAHLSTPSIAQIPAFKKSPVINIHNIHGDYLNYLALPRLLRHKTVLITLHDMWNFTGHCVYSFDCQRWKTGCGRCPYLNTYVETRRDASALELRLKRKTFTRIQPHFIAISRWILNAFRQSQLSHLPIHHIPNGIDTDTYRPIPKDFARNLLHLPQNKKIILYAAANLNDPRKGADLLIRSLALLPASLKQTTLLITIGTPPKTPDPDIGLPIRHLGFIHDDITKNIILNAADLLAFPTRADNLPLIIQEAMAAGLPTLSFRVGGVPDLIRHEDNGLLAEPENIEAFSHYLTLLLTHDLLRLSMSERNRIIATTEYPLPLQAQRYLELVRNVLNTPL